MSSDTGTESRPRDRERRTDTEHERQRRADAETDAHDAEQDGATADARTESPQQRRLEQKRERVRQQDRQAKARRELEEAENAVRLKVFRYDPEVEEKRKPRFDEFQVPFYKGMTVLDALIYARDHFDSSLTFRHSCRQAICGSDAFLVNGTQQLGCKTQVADLEKPVRVEPLPYYDVLKDLVVDLDDFYEEMHSMEPYFQSSEEPPGPLEERRQSRANREEIKTATRCIWCASCMSSCSIYGQGGNYVGPAAINVAYRFAMDERESQDVTKHRLNIINQENGVWRCQTQFSCTEVCPKDIPLTEHIQELKREAVKQDLRFW